MGTVMLSVVLLSLCGSLLSGWVVLGWLRRRAVVDRPNERSSHTVPTPRGGGIGILVPVVGALVYVGLRGAGTSGVMGVAGVLLVCSLVLAVISFVDDLTGVSAAVRFVAHVGVAVVTVGVLGWGGVVGGGWVVWVLLLVGVIWVTGYTNAFNFMDGINGIAGGQAVLTGVGTAVVGVGSGLPVSHPAVVLALAIAGAALGFLPYNIPRARMFMGDVGSATLGYLLAVLGFWVVMETGWSRGVAILALHLNFGLDTGVTLVRRILRGERWHEPHREHFYQRFVRSGWSHLSVTGLEMGLQLVVVVGLWWVLRLGGGVGGVVVHAVGTLVIWVVVFLVAEVCFRRGGGGAGSGAR